MKRTRPRDRYTITKQIYEVRRKRAETKKKLNKREKKLGSIFRRQSLEGRRRERISLDGLRWRRKHFFSRKPDRLRLRLVSVEGKVAVGG